MGSIVIIAVLWIIGWLIFSHLPGDLPKILIAMSWTFLAGIALWQAIVLLL